MLPKRSDDLNDNIDDLLGGPVTGERPQLPAHYKPADFTEPCTKCRGSGKFVGYTGRVLGPCFTCEGTGERTFKTSPEKRAQGRASAAKASAKREAGKAEWREEHKAELAWLEATARRQNERRSTGQKVWDFPLQLAEGFAKYGTLTDGQLDAVRRCMARDAERETQRKAEREARDAAAPAVDVSKLEAAFDVAKKKAASEGAMGIKRLHLRLQSGEHSLSFSPGSPGSQWDGMIFVREAGRDGEKLGWVKGGKFTRRFHCSDAQEAAILDACHDPLKAALAYGQKWSVCAVCGRELTNGKSIERGIGPICAEKYGW